MQELLLDWLKLVYSRYILKCKRFELITAEHIKLEFTGILEERKYLLKVFEYPNYQMEKMAEIDAGLKL